MKKNHLISCFFNIPENKHLGSRKRKQILDWNDKSRNLACHVITLVMSYMPAGPEFGANSVLGRGDSERSRTFQKRDSSRAGRPELPPSLQSSYQRLTANAACNLAWFSVMHNWFIERSVWVASRRWKRRRWETSWNVNKSWRSAGRRAASAGGGFFYSAPFSRGEICKNWTISLVCLFLMGPEGNHSDQGPDSGSSSAVVHVPHVQIEGRGQRGTGIA